MKKPHPLSINPDQDMLISPARSNGSQMIVETPSKEQAHAKLPHALLRVQSLDVYFKNSTCMLLDLSVER
jgi:hypothetical protein